MGERGGRGEKAMTNQMRLGNIIIPLRRPQPTKKTQEPNQSNEIIAKKSLILDLDTHNKKDANPPTSTTAQPPTPRLPTTSSRSDVSPCRRAISFLANPLPLNTPSPHLMRYAAGPKNLRHLQVAARAARPSGKARRAASLGGIQVPWRCRNTRAGACSGRTPATIHTRT